MEDIYVIGHRNPDTDSVISAIAAAKTMGYKAAVSGDINAETAFVLSKFGVEAPEKVIDLSGKKVFLVDHNENTQMADGWESAEIVGILDHHRINFSSSAPVFFHVEPLGSTCSILAKTFMDGIKNDSVLAGLLLAGILSDTVIFKSPTATDEDKLIAAELAAAAGIADIEAFGLEIKKAGADISGMTAADIVGKDFKDFDMSGKKVGIGQIELPDLSIMEEMESAVIARLDELKEQGYELVMIALTDIIKEGSKLIFSGDPSIIEKAFGKAPEKNSVYVDGMMSRKKQIVPPLEEEFKNR
jgi:manganese-dependent inorganic pyrophosphatase